MDNLWVTNGDDVVEWTAELSEIEPAALLGWVRHVLDAGVRHQVYEVVEAPGYRGDLMTGIERRFTEDGVLDLCHFASAGMAPRDGVTLRVAALMAYAESGEVVERRVENLGALLRALRPDDVDLSAGLMVDCPPIDLYGPLLRSPGPARVHFRLRSDIWFPWVLGFLADTFEVTPSHDNRPLAERHTPRLTAFLAEARTATEDVGGTWSLDEEVRFTRRDLVTEAGVSIC